MLKKIYGLKLRNRGGILHFNDKFISFSVRDFRFQIFVTTQIVQCNWQSYYSRILKGLSKFLMGKARVAVVGLHSGNYGCMAYAWRLWKRKAECRGKRV